MVDCLMWEWGSVWKHGYVKQFFIKFEKILLIFYGNWFSKYGGVEINIFIYIISHSTINNSGRKITFNTIFSKLAENKH